MTTPLVETSRKFLLPAYIGDVRAWKSDSPGETVILAVKAAPDKNDQTFYAMDRNGVLSLLGTTGASKDGGCQPLVYRDGRVAVLLTEAPEGATTGEEAALWLVWLQYRIGESAGDVELREALKGALGGI